MHEYMNFSALFDPEGDTNNSSPTIVYFPQKFDWKEYVVFFSVFVISSAIAIFYGCFGSRQKSTDEYLLANRRMSSVPVGISLLASFISSITLFGKPVEIYYYGLQYSIVLLAFIPLTISLAYFYVPVFFNLQLSSAYEYLELRFGKNVRTVVSLVAIVHYVLYISIAVYTPSIALSQVTGINMRISTAVTFLVCIFYSSLGGLRSVMWSDVWQFVIMMMFMVAVVWRGVIDIGGWKILWQRAVDSNRAELFNFDPDLRVRHTFWTSLIGGYFVWLSIYSATQSQIQRYLSMQSLSRVRRALFINMIGLTLIIGLCIMTGMILSGKYHNCDPVQFGAVSNRDQLVPLLVMETLGNYSGLVLCTGVLCATLSSVSSGLNAISAIAAYDYVRKWVPNISDETLSRISKGLCVAFGLLSYGFVFLAENMGNMLPAASTLVGVMVGPGLGIFTLGMFFPWANAKGSLIGFVISSVTMALLAVGANIASYHNQIEDHRLNITTAGCNEIFNSTIPLSLSTSTTSSPLLPIEFERTPFAENLSDILSISYIWYPTLACMLAIFFGLLFSLIFMKCEESRTVNPDLISPPVLWLLCRLFPSHMASWIEPQQNPMLLSSTSYSLGIRRKMPYSKETNCDIQINRISTISRISFSYR